MSRLSVLELINGDPRQSAFLVSKFDLEDPDIVIVTEIRKQFGLLFCPG